MDTTTSLIVGIPAILIAIIVHEFCHALAAYLLGDNTAKDAGRLTLNPIVHIDLFGTIIFPILMILTMGAAFGWAKPVPFNPYNLKFPRFGPAIVAIAGPFSNLIIASLSLISFKLLLPILDPNLNLLMIFLVYLAVINVVLLVFNLIPIPPLDGSKVLFAVFSDFKYNRFREVLEKQGPTLLIMLIVFDNLFNLNLFGYIIYPVIEFVYKIFS